jgi:MoaA/NifB/PqqE/SkfB family radical SAM enzyme
MTELEARQAAVNQQRLWVRLTRACNNHCIFCHDVCSHDGSTVPETEVIQRLRLGREQGATRAILSGGEPTIHPSFLNLVKAATDMGYSWVQCVSNGRMFAYEKFTARAMSNGLREATLSMHGHTPELFESLVGIPGSFQQSLAGLKNLLHMGAVVSVDVVLNRKNLPFLREILCFYIDIGVREFDLLHLVPFGRGFDEHRDELFASPDLLARELARALSVQEEVPGLFLWTNRLPIELLEGNEKLFQDPHKIYDEVMGERQIFKDLFAKGTQPDCLGDRCPYCFLKPFCDAARLYAAGGWDGPAENPCGVADAAFCAAARHWTDAELRAREANGLRIPMHEDFRKALAATPKLVDLDAMRARLVSPIDGLPPCMGGPIGCPRFPAPEAGVLGLDGRPDLAAFVSFFIRRLYRVKSLRCRSCRHDGSCPGLHVNLARIWGIGSLTPET